MLWAFRPVQDVLRRTDLFDDETVITIVGLIVALTLTALLEQDRRLRAVGDRLDAFTPEGATQVIEGGVQNVYHHLDAACLRSEKARRKTLDVLGLTLYTAWPHLKGWIDSEQARGWRIRLYCLSPEFIERHSDWLSEGWADNARTQIGDFTRFKAANERKLKDCKISLELRDYAFFPALHGFRVGGNTLFISFTHWERSDGQEPPRLDSPHQAYVFFPSSDESELAHAHRKLFENWLARADACATRRGG